MIRVQTDTLKRLNHWQETKIKVGYVYIHSSLFLLDYHLWQYEKNEQKPV